MEKKYEKLLKLLQDDATLTAQQLSVMLGMTEAEVQAAVRRLEKEGKTVIAHNTTMTMVSKIINTIDFFLPIAISLL